LRKFSGGVTNCFLLTTKSTTTLTLYKVIAIGKSTVVRLNVVRTNMLNKYLHTLIAYSVVPIIRNVTDGLYDYSNKADCFVRVGHFKGLMCFLKTSTNRIAFIVKIHAIYLNKKYIPTSITSIDESF